MAQLEIENGSVTHVRVPLSGWSHVDDLVPLPRQAEKRSLFFSCIIEAKLKIFYKYNNELTQFTK